MGETISQVRVTVNHIYLLYMFESTDDARVLYYYIIVAHLTGPDSLVDKASASGAGDRRLDSQCQRHWGSF